MPAASDSGAKPEKKSWCRSQVRGSHPFGLPPLPATSTNPALTCTSNGRSAGRACQPMSYNVTREAMLTPCA
jgi:hypothetical protein